MPAGAHQCTVFTALDIRFYYGERFFDIVVEGCDLNIVSVIAEGVGGAAGAVPGKGRTPGREIGNALRDVGYDGTVVMEPFVTMGGQVGQDIHVWRDISRGASEEQLDKDAHDAVVFQKYMLDWK